MPIWSQILKELRGTTQPDNPPDYDLVRRKYLAKLHQHTQRDTILYATAWLQKDAVSPSKLAIGDEDIQGFMEVCYGLESRKLDLILHSPGGSPTAAEGIVAYLRSRFNHIRVIVPQQAMSAATMVACAADEIVLAQHSFLGPTDPQIELATPLGNRLVPAQAVLDQFNEAKKQCADPAKLSAWLPMLGQYGPDLLVRCEAALEMSKELVQTWLEAYMFKSSEDRSILAKDVSDWLADHKQFKSHSRHLSRDLLEARKLKIPRLEDDDDLQDLSLSVFHATTHTFTGTNAVKIVESHQGRAFIKMTVPNQ